MDVKGFADYAKKNETWLAQRVIKYAVARGYTKYTATLEKDWDDAVSGLTDSLAMMAEKGQEIPELGPDEAYDEDPAVAFGIIEAQRHRTRGVTPPMFFGLMKYNRQAYLDLVAEMDCPESDKEAISLYVNRFFDRIELALIADWPELSNQANLVSLMDSNRAMTNRKNLYLTVFESLTSPVILLKLDHTVINMNHAAYLLFGAEESLSSDYNSETASSKCFQWLEGELGIFMKGGERDWMFNKELITREGVKVFQVFLSKMQDASEKFRGTVVALEDITEKTLYAKEQAYFAEHDKLTGQFNRRVLENALKRTVARAKRGVNGVLIYMDVDHLKAVNDGCGHQEGDRLLKIVADIIATHARAEDICARLGGDEFAILLDDATVDVAVAVADRIKKTLSLQYEMGSDFGIGISAGVVAIDGVHDYLSVMSRGDIAMYSAKSKGRNRIVVAQE